MPSVNNRQWRLSGRPEGLVRESDFDWREEPLPGPSADQVVVRNIYLSLDPANRGWMGERDTYVPAVRLGEVMRGFGLGVVESSRNERFQKGEIVQGTLGWQDYFLSDGRDLTKLPKDPRIPLTAYLGLFGHIGLTAYIGLLEIGRPRRGETLVVSAAAGAVGSLVGQIGKIQGCRVVGIAGRDEKCRWLTEELGFDAAINYRTGSLWDSLKEQCPEGIDVYFDSVGGKVLDAVLGQINKGARIAVCGMISQYNAVEPVPGPFNLINILVKSARMEGFIVLDYLKRSQEVMARLSEWYRQGRLRYRVDVVQGLENAPQALNRLFDGSNKGKLILQVSPEPAGE